MSNILSFTDVFYFQSLSPNPTTLTYFQPVNLKFVLALRSDGIFNGIETVGAFQYDAFGQSVGVYELRRVEGSSQIFVLELGHAGLNTAGIYTISMYANLLMTWIFNYLYLNLVVPGDPDEPNYNGIIEVMVESEFILLHYQCSRQPGILSLCSWVNILIY